MKPAAILALAFCAFVPVSCEKAGHAKAPAPGSPQPPPPATSSADYSSSAASVASTAITPVTEAKPAKIEAPPAGQSVVLDSDPAPKPMTKPESPAEKFKDQIAKLTPIQRHVTQESGTERAFTGEYWNNHEPGIYVDIVSNKPLFSSLDKFDSGCGWPSFAKTLAKDEVKELSDTTHGMVRTEVRSATADSHLGHVFDDGPPELGGLRYCINSASIRFVHLNDLEKEGFGEYKKLFEKKEEPKP